MDAAKHGAPTREDATGADREGGRSTRAPSRPTEEQVRDWLVAYLARLLDIDPTEVDSSAPLERYGLDSAAAVALTGDLARWLGIDLEPDLTRGHPTIDGVARHVAQELARQPSPAA